MLFRLSELNFFAKCFYSKDEINAISTEESKLEKLDEKIQREIGSRTSFEKVKPNQQEDDKSEKKLSFSSLINSSFLIEYMYYIFQAIFQIAHQLDHPYQGPIE